MDNSSPIGIFDSGIGGLTVASEVVKALPKENIVYIGDTARVPYGTRGKEVIKKFSFELVKFLENKHVKCLVVACNTISATCLEDIQRNSSVPVIGVIKPAAKVAVATTKNGKVGVLGTRATVSSNAYANEIQTINPEIEVTSIACPLFVPIAEEGLGRSEIARLTAKEYLGPIKKAGVDTVILGCTHYPLLKEVISKELPGVTIVDSAIPTTEELKKILADQNLLNDNGGERHFYVTDAPERVKEISNLFFGETLIPQVEKVILNS
jgi:glutamate racemase